LTESIFNNHKSRFERAFFSLIQKTSLKAAPTVLREATIYALSGKNKRLRPVLSLEACSLSGLTDDTAVSIAAAFECLHTYSLVHDDLPAMDDDDLRRGQPSTHIKYGESTAILVGDLLQALSFELLLRAKVPTRALEYFARAVGARGMVSGQFLDMQGQQDNNLTLHRLKTAKLIEAAIALPFLTAGEKLYLSRMRWGRELGLLFQITDDLLDITGDSAALGKTAGKDAAQKKKTVVALFGFDESKKRAQEIAQNLEQTARLIFPTSELFQSLPVFLLNRAG
jgi:geranylgeranyl pyrophosphate synthase